MPISLPAPRASRTITLLLPLVAVAGLAANKGGFFATSWGWVALGLCWAAATAAVLRQELSLSRTELGYVGGLGLLTAWTGTSALWSIDTTASVAEAERVVVYAAAALALALVFTREDVAPVLAAVLTAITGVAVFALATRLVADRVGVFDATGSYRLSQPIGYWNGLALFCAIGALLAFGFATHARRLGARALAGAVAVVLVVTLYFTFGRAGWIVLALGLVTAVAVERERLRAATLLLGIAAPTAAAVLLVSRYQALTSANSRLSDAARQGHRAALVVLACAAAAAAATALLALAETRLAVPLPLRRAYASLLLAAAIAAPIGGIVAAGGPSRLATRAHDAFVAPAPQVANLNNRLFSFSGSGRSRLWRVALDDYRLHSGLGSGAGSYERFFLANRPSDAGWVQDAHSLYLETLAELGPAGLALLLGALAFPLVALRRARRLHPLAPAAAGSYVAYLVHASVDWDWELAGVTIVAVFVGGAMLLAAREEHRAVGVAGGLGRGLAVGAIAAAAGFSLVGLVGNSALATSESDRAKGDLSAAASEARRASSWMPWSGDPWRALAAAQIAAGDTAAARASYRKGLSVDGSDWRLWFGLAQASRGAARAAALARATDLFPTGDLASSLGTGARGTGR